MIRRHFLKYVALPCLVVLFFSSPAHANAGLPMIAVVWPGMGVAIIPIIVIESFILSAGLGHGIWPSAGIVSIANVVSTLIGIPITWLLCLFWMPILQRIVGSKTAEDIMSSTTPWKKILATIGQAPWLPPYPERDFAWMAPVACLVLLVPFFFASWLIEYQVAFRMLPEFNRPDVEHSIFVGNLVTYGLLAAILLVWLIMAWVWLVEEISDDILKRTLERAAWDEKRAARDPAHERFIIDSNLVLKVVRSHDLPTKKQRMENPEARNAQKHLLRRLRNAKSRTKGRNLQEPIANELARRGMSELKAAETRISHKSRLLAEGQPQVSGRSGNSKRYPFRFAPYTNSEDSDILTQPSPAMLRGDAPWPLGKYGN